VAKERCGRRCSRRRRCRVLLSGGLCYAKWPEELAGRCGEWRRRERKKDRRFGPSVPDAIVVGGRAGGGAPATNFSSLAAWFEEREKRGDRRECGDLWGEFQRGRCGSGHARRVEVVGACVSKEVGGGCRVGDDRWGRGVSERDRGKAASGCLAWSARPFGSGPA
jgi:hypothetical protein